MFDTSDALHNEQNNNHFHFTESHHVLQVNEGVVDGGDLDALLQAGPEDQTPNAAKSTQTKAFNIFTRRISDVSFIIQECNFNSIFSHSCQSVENTMKNHTKPLTIGKDINAFFRLIS